MRSSRSRRLAQQGIAGMVGQAAAHALLLLVTVASVMPFVWMFFGSFKSYVELTTGSSLWPKVWTLANYEAIVFRVNFLRAFLNSVLVAVPRTLSALITSSAVGYVFAKYRFWGKDLLFTLLLSTMMVPFATVMVPLYITVSDLHLVNKLGGIIVTAIYSTFGTFLLRQFIEGIPDELLDAARIDGASEWWIFTRLIIPLSGSPLAALAVFTFFWSWDEYLWPTIVLTDLDVKTLPLVLAGLRTLYWNRYDMWAAGSMLTVAPVMLLYSLAQRQFIRGIALTGMKA